MHINVKCQNNSTIFFIDIHCMCIEDWDYCAHTLQLHMCQLEWMNWLEEERKKFKSFHLYTHFAEIYTINLSNWMCFIHLYYVAAFYSLNSRVFKQNPYTHTNGMPMLKFMLKFQLNAEKIEFQRKECETRTNLW